MKLTLFFILVRSPKQTEDQLVLHIHIIKACHRLNSVCLTGGVKLLCSVVLQPRGGARVNKNLKFLAVTCRYLKFTPVIYIHIYLN